MSTRPALQGAMRQAARLRWIRQQACALLRCGGVSCIVCMPCVLRCVVRPTQRCAVRVAQPTTVLTLLRQRVSALRLWRRRCVARTFSAALRRGAARGVCDCTGLRCTCLIHSVPGCCLCARCCVFQCIAQHCACFLTQHRPRGVFRALHLRLHRAAYSVEALHCAARALCSVTPHGAALSTGAALHLPLSVFAYASRAP